MPHNFREFLMILGFSFILYAIGRILHSVSLFLSDSGKPIPSRISLFAANVFYIAGFWISIPTWLLNYYPYKRTHLTSFDDGRLSERKVLSVIHEASIEAALEQQADELHKTYKEKMHDFMESCEATCKIEAYSELEQERESSRKALLNNITRIRMHDWRKASLYWVKRYTGSTDDFDPTSMIPAEYSALDKEIVDDLIW